MLHSVPGRSGWHRFLFRWIRWVGNYAPGARWLALLLTGTTLGFIALACAGPAWSVDDEDTSTAEAADSAAPAEDSVSMRSSLTEDGSAAPDDSSASAPPANSLKLSDSKKYDLRYKFRAGETARWEVIHRAAVDTTMQGTNQTAETRTTSIKVWQVKTASADKILLIHSVESVDMWQKTQGHQEVRYNSRTDKTPPPGYEQIASAVGKPLTELTIDAHGKVLAREEKAEQANNSGTPIALKLPAEPVSIGYSWSVPVDFEVLLQGGHTKKIPARHQYTLAKVASDVATIEVDTQVLAPLNDPEIEAQVVQKMVKGEIKFDLEKGRVLSQQMDADRIVIGFRGGSSSMHYLMRFTEKAMPPQPATAAKKPAAANAATAAGKAPAVAQKTAAATSANKKPAAATAPARR